jgi:hypothetical protein
MQNRKRFNVPGGPLFDLTAKGTFIGAPKDDILNVMEFDDLKKVQNWTIEGEKLELKFFKQNYLLLLQAPKDQNDTST